MLVVHILEKISTSLTRGNDNNNNNKGDETRLYVKTGETVKRNEQPGATLSSFVFQGDKLFIGVYEFYVMNCKRMIPRSISF